jgi:hypothetical protein
MICRFGWPIGSKAWEDRKVGGAPKITHGVTTHRRTVSAPPRVRLSNYRRHAHRGGTGDRASADPGLDERPVPPRASAKRRGGDKAGAFRAGKSGGGNRSERFEHAGELERGGRCVGASGLGRPWISNLMPLVLLIVA